MTSWVLIDETDGAACQNGEKLTPAALAHIAEAIEIQANRDYAAEYGGAVRARVAADANDILEGEQALVFKSELPEAPQAVAYHDNNGVGVPFAFCAVTDCESLFGKNGVSVATTHETLEAEGDPGCNEFADDNKGTLHAREDCDAVEVQSYAITCADGTRVEVSNFVLKSWYNPNGQPPYDYMSKAGLPGAVAPPGPLATAASPDGQGNYQIVEPSSQAQETQVFGKVRLARHEDPPTRVVGSPKNVAKVMHWNSRLSRRIAARKKEAPRGAEEAVRENKHAGRETQHVSLEETGSLEEATPGARRTSRS